MSERIAIVGGGLNGLAAAALLARAGREVQLFEAREELGGLSAGEPLAPGLRSWGERLDAAPPVGLLEDLQLERHGLRWSADSDPLWVAADTEPGLAIADDPGAMWSRLPADEAQGYAELRARLERWRPPLLGLLAAVPPDLGRPGTLGLADLGRRAWGLLRLSSRDQTELAASAPMAVRDWLENHLGDPRLMAGLATRALAGTTAGPRSAGTTAHLILDTVLRGAEPEGGGPALVEALARAARAEGAQLHTATRVEGIVVGAAGVEGLRLEGGEVAEAPTVVSTVDVASTLLELIDPGALPDRLEAVARTWKRRARTAVVHAALRGELSFPAAGGGEVRRLTTATDLERMERAADDPKHGRMAADPWAELRVRSQGGGETGGTVVTLHLHGVPGERPDEVDGGEVEAQARALLERLSPGADDRLVTVVVKTPADLEREYGLAGGHLHHGEAILDQLWVQRPSLSCARYRTPLPGLVLGGASCHPGGALVAGAGALAARALLA